MNKYKVRIQYARPSGTFTFYDTEVEALNHGDARRKAKRELMNNPHRKVKVIDNSQSVQLDPPANTVSGSVAVEGPPWQQVPKRPLVHAGDVITVSAPVTGRIVHWKNGKGVTIVSDGGAPLGHFGRDTFEAVTNTRLEQAPPQTKTTFVSIYPRDEKYSEDYGPVKSSSYGVDNLVQVKITRTLDGKLVSKEFV